MFRIPQPARRMPLRLVEETHALRKWVGIGALVGACCGVAAILFLWAVSFADHNFLGRLAGYHVSDAGLPTIDHPVALLVVPALGGLLGGALVWKWAPEASGIGTDAAIRAFHAQKPISMRTTAVKLVASALTIGSGGTSGREGPIAQVGAGAGSTVARWLRLSPREHGIALAAGLGAGIAAMFKAPLAGTIIAAEVFYREDFEVEALVPTLVAAVVGYSIVGFTYGWQPLFTTHLDPFSFGHPAGLLLYALLGILCGLMARFAIAVFPLAQSAFRRLPLVLATTLGGLCVGSLAFAMWSQAGIAPMVGTGAPWLQMLFDGQGFAQTPASGLLLLAALAEISGLTLTLASGGSGGVFGPSLVVGGFLGAAFGVTALAWFPGMAAGLVPFTVVGMVAYFAAAAKAPLGTIVMVVEMTGGYGLLAPAMVATMFSFLLSGHSSMFPSQVRNRLASPAHAAEYQATILHRHRVVDVLRPDPTTVRLDTPVREALDFVLKTGSFTLPVMEEGRLVGLVTLRDLQRMPEVDRGGRMVRDVLAPRLVVVTPTQDLFEVLALLLEHDLNAIPVVAAGDRAALVGLVTRRDIGNVVRGASAKLADQTVAAPA